MGGMNLLSCKAGGDAADFLHRPPDQFAVLRLADRIVFGGCKGGVLADTRITAIIANASIASAHRAPMAGEIFKINTAARPLNPSSMYR